MLELVYKHAVNGIVILRNERSSWIVESFNETLRELFAGCLIEKKLDDCIERPLEQFVQLLFTKEPAEVSRFNQTFDLAIQMGKKSSLETQFYCGSEKLSYLEITCSPSVTVNAPYATLSFRDIMAQKRDEQEKERLQTQLLQAQKLEIIGRVAAGIAHDFNNVLTGMMGHLDLAKALPLPQGRIHDHLNALMDGAHRARELVKQLLTFGQKRSVERKRVQLELIVLEVIKLLEASKPSAIKIEFESEPGLANIYADPTQMYQVVMNLATNAVQAMGERSGTLGFKLNHVSILSPLKSGSEAPDGEYVQLQVSDTGMGMSQSTLDKIFDPFFSTKPMGTGTGLGLSVVRRILNDHQAIIRVKSKIGRGSIFTILFPAKPKDTNLDPGSSIILLSEGHGKRILSVEDDKPVASATEQTLRHLGYQTTTLHNPVEAIEFFKKNPGEFDAVLTDLAMPGISGIEMTRQLRSISDTIPIILCSGVISEEEAKSAKSAGITTFLEKPFRVKELARLLTKLLKQS